jgi:hypothetical protein
MVNTVAVCTFSRFCGKDDLLHSFIFFRRVHQRLLPQTPGRDQRAVEHYPCVWRFQRRILPGPMGNETRRIANV